MAYILHSKNALRLIMKENSDHKLGNAGETVKVAPAYFRSHLMPKLLAVPNIEKYAHLIREQRRVLRRLPNIEKLHSCASKDDPLELHSPVTKEELVAGVARQLSVSLKPENLHLPSPLLAFGEYEVPTRLPRSIPLPEGKVHWTLKVKVRGK